MELDINAFKEVVNKIDGVLSTKFVASDDTIEELHVLSNTLRSPKQIARDIESSLLAAFDFRIDRRVISIAQIHTDDKEEIRRIRFSGVTFTTDGNLAQCTVKLVYDDQEYSVPEVGIKTSSKREKLVARSTIKAVEKILGQSDIFDIQDVVVDKKADISFAVVLVSAIIKDMEEAMIGSAIVKADINEAIAKATLDAVNRRVQKINL
jgi:hypothetical protein